MEKWPHRLLQLLQKFGTAAKMSVSTAGPTDAILAALDRQRSISALESLSAAVKAKVVDAEMTTAAIVLDANVFLRIPNHKRSVDIVDYLVGVHTPPLVIPGQVIQEFWNNQLSAINTVYKSIHKKYSDLFNEVVKAKDSGISGLDDIESALSNFKAKHEHVFEPDLSKKVSGFIDKLVARASVPFAPREPFYDMAEYRKKAKTPPGFRDGGDGDFWVWIDALFGLLEQQAKGEKFSKVILVSNDEKIDWCRGDQAHPILVAEMKAILKVEFQIWTLDKFASKLP